MPDAVMIAMRVGVERPYPGYHRSFTEPGAYRFHPRREIEHHRLDLDLLMLILVIICCPQLFLILARDRRSIRW